MKSTLAFLFAAAATINGFVIPNFGVVRRSSTARAARVDTSALIEEALKTTATFGINSKEAQVAWDIIEEMDASDNSAASQADLSVECPVEEEVSAKCEDYEKFLAELYTIRDLLKENGQKASLADTLKLIKMTKPEGVKVESSPKLTAALEGAKKATAEFGIASSQARLAWEEYEEIASSGLDNAIGINLEDECSLESGQEACQAMEELERIMPVLQALSSDMK